MKKLSHWISPLREKKAEEINEELLTPVVTTGRGWLVLTAVSVLGVLVGGFAFLYQLNTGMTVTGLNNPVNWAFYIVNFVFWVGISHSGTMISAILRLVRAEWRYPVTRAAEAMTLFSLMMAGLFPLIHLGRNWLFWYLIPLPWGRGLWPNFRSPLLWDETAIFTYMTGSSLFLYLALIPDLAAYRDRVSGWRRKLYAFLSLGFRATHFQWRWFEKASFIMTVLIIPVFVSVHTIVSWDFGMTVVPGWHSSIFAPYFVVGAILSGVAAVVTLMAILRKGLKIQNYITPDHFDELGKMLLGVSLLWSFFFLAETLTVLFSGETAAQPALVARTIGSYFPLFVFMIMANAVIPVCYFSVKRLRRFIPGMLIVSVLINVGMYIERVLIIVPSLSLKGPSFSWGSYSPSWVEIAISIGAFCGFSLLYLLFIKLFPLIPVWEIKEGEYVRSYRKFKGKEIAQAIGTVPPPLELARNIPDPNKGYSPQTRRFLSLFVLSALSLLALLFWVFARTEKQPFLPFFYSQFLFWLGACLGGAMLASFFRLARANWRLSFTRAGELLLLGSIVLLCLLPYLQNKREAFLSSPGHAPGFWPALIPALGKKIELLAFFLFLLPAFFVLAQSLALERPYLSPTLAKAFSLFSRLLSPFSILRRATLDPRAKLKYASTLCLIFSFVLLTLLSWGYGLNLIPEWESTLFAPYFVVTSLQSGAALLLLTSFALSAGFRLRSFSTREHGDQLGKFMVALALFWFYFHFAEFLTVWYSHLPHELEILGKQTTKMFFWVPFFGNFLLPFFFFSSERFRRFTPGVLLVAAGILVSTNIERFSMFLPLYQTASPLAGGFFTALRQALLLPALLVLLIALCLFFLPPLAKWEYMDAEKMRGERKEGAKLLPTYSLCDPEEVESGKD